MAAPRWQNVAAPDFSTSLAALRSSGSFLGNAFTGLKESIGRVDAKTSERENAAFQLELLKFKENEELEAALAADPSLGFNGKRLNTASVNAAAGRGGQLLGQAIQEQNLEAGEFGLGRSKYDFGRLQDKDARTDAARPFVSQALQAAMNGDESQFSQILKDNPQISNSDGFAEFISKSQGLISGDVGLDGARQNQSQSAKRFDWEGDGQRWKEEDRQVMIDAEGYIAQIKTNYLPEDQQAALNSLGLTDGRVYNAVSNALGFGGNSGPSGPGGGASSGGGGSGSTDVMDLIRDSEGFRTKTYWDVNHHRVGYGSDTITKADGSVVTVKKGMTVTRADAERDLNRRVGLLRDTAGRKIGRSWSNLPQGAQSAIISVAYNYGEGHDRLKPLWAAARSGDLNKISSIIKGFAGDNNGVNRGRRLAEAALVYGSESPGDTARKENVLEVGRRNARSDLSDPIVKSYYDNAEYDGTLSDAAQSLSKDPVLKGLGAGARMTYLQEITSQARGMGIKLNPAQAVDVLRNSVGPQGWLDNLNPFTSTVAGSDAFGDDQTINKSLITSNLKKIKTGATENNQIARGNIKIAAGESRDAGLSLRQAQTRLSRARSQGIVGNALAPYILAVQNAQNNSTQTARSQAESPDVTYNGGAKSKKGNTGFVDLFSQFRDK